LSTGKWNARKPTVIAGVVCLVALCGVVAVWSGLIDLSGGSLPSAASVLQTVPVYPGAYNIKTWQSSYNLNDLEPSSWDEEAVVSFTKSASSTDVESFYYNWLVSAGWQRPVPWASATTNGISTLVYVNGRSYFKGFQLVNNWPQIKWGRRDDFQLGLFVEPISPSGTKASVSIRRLQSVPDRRPYVPPPQNTAPVPVPTR
jgi:hypothetical protein